MAEFDLNAALRWARFDAKKSLRPRKDVDLPFLGELAEAGPDLLLHSSVYIDGLQGRAPHAIGDLLVIRQIHHSTIAIQELMHAVGVLDPNHSGTPTAIKQITAMVKDMPCHRTFAPDRDVLGRAALLSGVLCRLQGYKADERLRALHDCALFLQAQKRGLTVLTGNVSDFDYILQMVPTGRAIVYRPI